MEEMLHSILTSMITWQLATWMKQCLLLTDGQVNKQIINDSTCWLTGWIIWLTGWLFNLSDRLIDWLSACQRISYITGKYNGFKTRTYDALAMVNNEIMPLAREDASITVLLFTDGESNGMTDARDFTISTAKWLKTRRNMTLIAVGVGVCGLILSWLVTSILWNPCRDAWIAQLVKDCMDLQPRECRWVSLPSGCFLVRTSLQTASMGSDHQKMEIKPVDKGRYHLTAVKDSPLPSC